MFILGVAVAATNVPRTAVGLDTPRAHGLAYEDVTFSTADGVELSGWYVPSRNGAAVVLLHGAGSTRSAVLAHAVVLADDGFGVLLYDARGHGRSQGRAMDFGWYGDLDVAAAVDFVAGQAGVAAGTDRRARVVDGRRGGARRGSVRPSHPSGRRRGGDHASGRRQGLALRRARRAGLGAGAARPGHVRDR